MPMTETMEATNLMISRFHTITVRRWTLNFYFQERQGEPGTTGDVNRKEEVTNIAIFRPMILVKNNDIGIKIMILAKK